MFQVSYGIYTEYITIYTVRRNSTVGGEARTSPGDSVPGNVLLVRMTLYSRRMARRPQAKRMAGGATGIKRPDPPHSAGSLNAGSLLYNYTSIPYLRPYWQ